MSKYRVVYHAHTFSSGLSLLLAVLCISAVVSLPTHPISFPHWQALLCVFITSVIFVSWRAQSRAQGNGVASVDEEGRWVWLQPSTESINNTVWLISQQSRATSFVLFIHLVPVVGSNGKGTWIWLLRNDLSEDNFRRLCRIIKHREVQQPLI